MSDGSAASISSFFSSLMLLYGGCIFGCMLSYVITDMPKNAMSVAIGLAHALCILVSLLMTFLALPVGSDGKNPRPKSLGARHKPLFKQRLLFLFHVTLGTFIISDPLFLKEKEPSDSAGPIGKVLYQLLISGAACQAAGVVTTFAVQAITPE